MKPTSNIVEEESRRIFWVIQTIFGFIIGSSFFSYASIIIPPFSGDVLTVSLALFSIYLCVVWSWIDFSYTLIIRPYKFKGNLTEVYRFFTDLIIVLVYTYILAYVEYIDRTPYDKSILGFFIGFFAINFGYFLSGYLRIIAYGKIASKLKVIIKYSVLSFIVIITYYAISNFYGNNVCLNRIFIIITILLTVSYRVERINSKKRECTIAIDVDGVLANQITGILPIIKKDLGVSLNYDDITDWNFPIKNTSIDKIIVAEQQQRSYVINMPIHEGAVNVIDNLMGKHYIAIATARPPESDEWTKEWLYRNKIPYDRFYNVQECGKQNANEDFDILIDDYIGNIEPFLAKHEGKAILFAQPWNQDRSTLKEYFDSGRLVVANNWNEVEEKVKELLSNS